MEITNGQPWRQQYQFNDKQSSDITGWSVGTSLYGVSLASQAIVTKNRVYLLGGLNNHSTYTAPIDSDGMLGEWIRAQSLPDVLAHSQAIVTKNRVYLLGGMNSTDDESLPVVYTSTINKNGVLGEWVSAPPLPDGLSRSQAIVTKNRVYLLGGYGVCDLVSTVYTAVINNDGTLGEWVTDTPLPCMLHSAQAIVTKNRVYLLGGWDGRVWNAGSFSTVYTAPINEDGTLGEWVVGTPLPCGLYASQTIVTRNKVYLLGGRSDAHNLSIVYTASINEDGTLEKWVISDLLPGMLSNAQVIVTKNRVHLLSGITSFGPTFMTFTAPILGGLNDYSCYYSDAVNSTE